MDSSENNTGINTELRAGMSARWGFDAPPFAPMPTITTFKDRFFFPSYQHLRALGFVGQLLWSHASLAAIISEDGMGKSLLVNRLRSDLDSRVLTATVQATNTQDPQEFLLSVLRQFGMSLEDGDRNDRRKLLLRFLSHQYSLNRLCLLVVEGVHLMRPTVLDELRQIAEMAIDEHRLVKLLLLGSPALKHIIDAPRMASLCEGRAPRLTLDCFSEDQVAAYVVHRLRAAGAEDPDAIIPPMLMMSIHRYTGGRLAWVNRLCENALLFATQENERAVSKELLDRAAETLGLLRGGFPSESTSSTPSSPNADEGALLLPDQAILVVTVQGGGDGVVPLLSNRMLLGRGETADVRVESAFVSRYHALIVRETQTDDSGTSIHRDILIDLGSTNGIVVNGKRKIRHLLKHRDLLQIGTARVTYLNPMQAPPQESDSSETLSLHRTANESESGPAIVGFGRLDEVG
jgi:general secretion pathway protein A